MREKRGTDRLLMDVDGTKVTTAGVDGRGDIGGRVHPPRIQLLLGQRQDQTHHLGPEIPETRRLIVYASQQGAAIGAGRSAASYEGVLPSIPSGLTHAAHTFNATVGLHHRQPGTVEAVLTCDGITAEVIAGNTHLHPVVGRVLVRAKGANTSVLVTDAIRIRR